VAIAGLVLGLAFLVGQLLAGDTAFMSLWKARIVALLTMVVGGAARSFWAGDPVEEAEAGGIRVKFGATRRAITQVNARVTSQMSDINRRLYDLEAAVFKADESE
jgi:hypothetical protein